MCSPQSSNTYVSAFSRSQNVFLVGSKHRRPPFCSAQSPISPEANPSCLRKSHVYRKTDRFLLVALARMVRSWKQALFIVQPETLLRWHRELFRVFWKHKSKPHTRKTRLS